MPDELTVEFTSALIRRDRRVLVRIERDWTGDDRWRIAPDRALRSYPEVPERVVDDWLTAYNTAGSMARSLLAFESAVDSARAELTATWPRFQEARDEAGELVATNTFTRTCVECRGEVSVIGGVEQPHECEVP